MPTGTTYKRLNKQTGEWYVYDPDKQDGQQPSQQRPLSRANPQGPPEGHPSASENSSSAEDSPDRDQSAGVRQLAAQLADATTEEDSDSQAEDTDSPASKPPTCASESDVVPPHKRREYFRRRAHTVEKKCLELYQQAGVAYAIILAAEVPGPRNTKELVHIVAGTPDLKKLLVQPNGSLHRPVLTAVCHDMDGDSAIAEVERLIRDAQGKQTEGSLRKLAREAAKIEVNAHHGLVGNHIKSHIYQQLDAPDWWPDELGSYGPNGLNLATKKTLLNVLLNFYDRRKQRLLRQRERKQRRKTALPRSSLPQVVNLEVVTPQSARQSTLVAFAAAAHRSRSVSHAVTHRRRLVEQDPDHMLVCATLSCLIENRALLEEYQPWLNAGYLGLPPKQILHTDIDKELSGFLVAENVPVLHWLQKAKVFAPCAWDALQSVMQACEGPESSGLAPMLPLLQPEHALLDWSEFNSLTLGAYIPEGEKWDKLIPWIDNGCVGQPDLRISIDDLDKEGVSTLIHADMVPYLQFIRDKGVLDDSAWAALQVGMQAGMAAIAEDDGDGMDILAAAAANSSDLDGALSDPGPSSPMRRTRAAIRAAASQAPAAIAPAQPTQKSMHCRKKTVRFMRQLYLTDNPSPVVEQIAVRSAEEQGDVLLSSKHVLARDAGRVTRSTGSLQCL